MSVPELTIDVVGAEHVEHAAAPTMRFTLEAQDSSGLEVYTVALTAQINMEPAKRRYDGDDRDRLGDLFGEAERWPATTHSFVWSTVGVLVPTFRGRASFELPVPCTYDHEVAGTKYLASLEDGEVPLAFHFSGTVLYRNHEDRLQMTRVPWSESAYFGMPVAAWRAMIDHYFPRSGWLRLHADTLAELRRRAAERGLPSMESCVLDLLAERDAVS